ncbi:MAG: hypothetical protein N2C12_03745, partial [Planctomycetales bacterium]
HLNNRRVGVVGLGVGTLAAYGNPGDDFRFYEINPGVVRLVCRPLEGSDPNTKYYFTYLDYLDKHDIEYKIIMGDARNSLEREDDWNLDVLVLDAFSSDAIPLHLLTVEAFEIYLRHMRNEQDRQGIIAVHISNRYLNLMSITQAMAQQFDLDIGKVESDGDSIRLQDSATWILLSRKGGLDAILENEGVEKVEHLKNPPAFTDDFINLPGLLKGKKDAAE